MPTPGDVEARIRFLERGLDALLRRLDELDALNLANDERADRKEVIDDGPCVGSLRVKVEDVAHAPLAGALVILELAGRPFAGPFATGADGWADLGEQPGDPDYFVRVIYTGFPAKLARAPVPCGPAEVTVVLGPCATGTFCWKVQGCGPGAVGFLVELLDADGVLVDSRTVDANVQACFSGLAGGATFTVRLSKPPRYRTDEFTFTTPCTAYRWTYRGYGGFPYPMQPAAGYRCCFDRVFPYPISCPDPIKLPLTVNDGTSDVEWDGSSALVCFTVHCEETLTCPDAGTGSCYSSPAVPEPGDAQVAVQMSGCLPSGAYARSCWGQDAYGSISRYPIKDGGCDGPAVCDDGLDVGGLGGSCRVDYFGVLPPTIDVACGPYMASVTFPDLPECLQRAYPGGLTLTVTEAP